jgi:murein DD-endopeptidase MepM/ murein hydrolase activator NlpD
MKKLFLLSLMLLPLLGTFSTPKPAEAASCSDVKIQMSGNVKVPRGRGWTVCNGKYRLSFQSDGNLVLYNSSKEPIWATGTDGSNADVLAVQSDGNVVLYGQGRALWATNTDRAGSVFAIQSDGNIVVYNRNRQPVFYTSTDMGQLRTFNAAAEWRGSSAAPAPAPAQSNINPVAPVPSLEIIDGCHYGETCAGGGARHLGADYVNSPGTSVSAICDGSVVYSNQSEDIWNRLVIIKHDNCAGKTLYGYYGHVDSNLDIGSPVSRGQTIGSVGDPNPSHPEMTPHIHFGVSTSYTKNRWGYYNSSYSGNGWINPQSLF